MTLIVRWALNSVGCPRNMGYELEFLDAAGEQSRRKNKASVIYRFSVSNGSAKTHADVVITYVGAKVIEQGGKDPTTAAKIALDRLLKNGRDPFKSQIHLQIPYGRAEYFSKYGNYNSLPVLTD
jgi:hypothetical protein